MCAVANGRRGRPPCAMNALRSCTDRYTGSVSYDPQNKPDQRDPSFKATCCPGSGDPAVCPAATCFEYTGSAEDRARWNKQDYDLAMKARKQFDDEVKLKKRTQDSERIVPEKTKRELPCDEFMYDYCFGTMLDDPLRQGDVCRKVDGWAADRCPLIRARPGKHPDASLCQQWCQTHPQTCATFMRRFCEPLDKDRAGSLYCACIRPADSEYAVRLPAGSVGDATRGGVPVITWKGFADRLIEGGQCEGSAVDRDAVERGLIREAPCFWRPCMLGDAAETVLLPSDAKEICPEKAVICRIDANVSPEVRVALSQNCPSAIKTCDLGADAGGADAGGGGAGGGGGGAGGGDAGGDAGGGEASGVRGFFTRRVWPGVPVWAYFALGGALLLVLLLAGGARRAARSRKSAD